MGIRAIEKKTAGFTLLEVMASVAILGLGIVMIIQLFSGGLGLAGASRDKTELVLYAKEKMAGILARETLIEGVESGENGGLGWRAEITPYDTGQKDEKPYTFKVSLSVSNTGRRASMYTLTSLKTLTR